MCMYQGHFSGAEWPKLENHYRRMNLHTFSRLDLPLSLLLGCFKILNCFSQSPFYACLDGPQLFLLLFKYEGKTGDIKHIRLRNSYKLPVLQACFMRWCKPPLALSWTSAK